MLLVQLKRFSWNGNEVKKSKAFIQCPFVIDPFGLSNSYELVATISHLNSVSSGHYIATVNKGSNWFVCDDRSVQKVHLHKVINPDTYLLLYTTSIGGISGPG